MTKLLAASLLLFTLAGCAGVPVSFQLGASECSGGRETTYNCQVERYSKAGL